MPKIVCKCGNWISYSPIPNPAELLFISDVEYDAFTDKIEPDELYDKMKHILVCDQCERLWVYWNGFQSEPTCYSKETDTQGK
ncbi:hypothetical protein F0P96_06405 [Hymenobacter busanensis]|uniref:Uncharacterized protein n=1 Tax=Hymenobacter busanensis TaxID=2607656 RepID=A0AA88FJX0_9BACT|nr:hypothetical protein F0P96_06405 [Hymenobacter busanensis]